MSESSTARDPDILVRSAPSLSATSDAPITQPEAPPVSASNNPADQDTGIPAEMSPEAQAAVARRTRADTAPDAGKDAAADPKDAAADKTAKQPDADPEIDSIKVDGKEVPLPPWMKREITKARNRQREAEASAKATLDELAALKAKVEELTSKTAEPVAKTDATTTDTTTQTDPPARTTDAADPRPTRDQFDDPDAYDEALTAWGRREGEREAIARTEAAEREKTEKVTREAQEAAIAKINADWEAKKAEAVTKYPDFEEVAMSDAVKITPTMAHTIMTAPNGPDVAYHLGRNPAEAERIAALGSPLEQAMQMGMLAARLSAPAQRAPRPQPLDPIDSGTSMADISDREPSMEEVAARVNKRYSDARRPFITA